MAAVLYKALVHIPHFEIDFVQIALKQMTLHGPEAI